MHCLSNNAADWISGMFRGITNVCKLLLVLVSMSPATALSGVIVNDTVAVKGEKLLLRAETKGKIFSKGGELVEFLVDGKSLGKNLSGGDGLAFKGFTPTRTGLYEIRARSGLDENSGLLLSLERGDGIVFVDIEGSLSEDVLALFAKKPREGSQEAIEEIHKSFPVVFLKTGFLSTGVMKSWLKENEFMELPVMAWSDGKVFHEIVRKGLRIEAVIAGPDVIESAKGQKSRAFSFEEVEEAEKVRDWKQIVEGLKEQ